jgi:hypothetical protein
MVRRVHVFLKKTARVRADTTGIFVLPGERETQATIQKIHATK